MKKLIAVLVVLITVANFVTVGAGDNSKEGKKVENEIAVMINGSYVGKAIVIEDTSYVPIRSISSDLGVNVNHDGGAVVIYTDRDQLLKEREEYIELKKRLHVLKSEIEMLDIKIMKYESEYEKESSQQLFDLIVKLTVERFEKEQELLSLI